MDGNLEKLEENQEGVGVCTGDRAPKKRIERTCVRAQKKEIDHKAIDRSPTAIDRTSAGSPNQPQPYFGSF
jgi:hypothetical protein